jgi:hypothetical protein
VTKTSQQTLLSRCVQTFLIFVSFKVFTCIWLYCYCNGSVSILETTIILYYCLRISLLNSKTIDSDFVTSEVTQDEKRPRGDAGNMGYSRVANMSYL